MVSDISLSSPWTDSLKFCVVVWKALVRVWGGPRADWLDSLPVMVRLSHYGSTVNTPHPQQPESPKFPMTNRVTEHREE